MKVVIFDLDGVLLDAKKLHFDALNEALPSQYKISYDQHLSSLDGLPTRRKLEIIKLPQELIEETIKKKNIIFAKYLETIEPDIKLQHLFQTIKKRWQKKIYVASNAITETVNTALQKLGLSLLVDGFYSNQSVTKPKPHPEIYSKIMCREGVGPHECLIVEDSPIGLKAAYRSGAHVLRVNSPADLSIELLSEKLQVKPLQCIWEDKNLNILVPMAGNGQRFIEAGFTSPKPFIKFVGKTLVQWAVDSLKVKGNLKFLAKEEHSYILSLLYPESQIIPVKNTTEGAACTTLLAADYIDNDNPLLIVNCDQCIQYDALRFFYEMQHVDGGILTFYSKNPQWSYALANDKIVSKVAEKDPISSHATCGVYYWKKGSDYVKYARQMIAKNIRTNNEFYVCPVFNEAITDGKIIKIFPVNNMFGLGTPQDLEVVKKTFYDFFEMTK